MYKKIETIDELKIGDLLHRSQFGNKFYCIIGFTKRNIVTDTRNIPKTEIKRFNKVIDLKEFKDYNGITDELIKDIALARSLDYILYHKGVIKGPVKEIRYNFIRDHIKVEKDFEQWPYSKPQSKALIEIGVCLFCGKAECIGDCEK